MKFIRANMFYSDAHQKVFEAITELFNENEPIDMLTVVERLKKLGNLEMVGGAFYVAQLTAKIGATANIEYHARIIFQKYIQRLIIENSNELVNKAFEDSTDVFELMEEFEHMSVSMRSELDKPEFMAEQIADEFIKELESPANTNVGSIFITRKIGFPSFDRIISWAPNKLLLLAGAAKDGKTKIASMMAFQLLKNDAQTSIYWVTLEDTQKDIFASYLAQNVYLKPKQILSKRGFTKKHIEGLKAASEQWKKHDITFYDQSIKIAGIKSRFKAWCELRKDRFKVLIIDNLLSLEDKNEPNFIRNQNGLYDYVIGACSDIKRDTDAFIILLHHFRDSQGEKGNVESGFRPHVADIKGTEASRRIPNYILLLNNPSRRKELLNQYEGNKRHVLEHLMIIDPAAIRDEENTGDAALIRLYGNLNYTHFIDLSYDE